jgi:hypothetical protein
MPWSQAEIEALRGLYHQSSHYSRRYGGPTGGLTYDQIAAQMSEIGARENWPARRYTRDTIARQVWHGRHYLSRPPTHLEPLYNGPSGPPGYNFPVNFNFR